MSQARRPDGEHPPLLILTLRKLKYKIRILRPGIRNIYLHGPTRKQNPINLLQNSL